MVQTTITRKKAGTSICITVNTTDCNDASLTPSGGVAITIYDPKGVVVVSEGVMVEESTGVYRYHWQTTTSNELGMYKIKAVAVDGSKTSIFEDRKAFELY